MTNFFLTALSRMECMMIADCGLRIADLKEALIGFLKWTY
jgi:hypothetical protein